MPSFSAMEKPLPLWHKLYFDPVYTAVARAIGYQGCIYRDLLKTIETLTQDFDKRKVESAIYQIATFEGQMSATPKPLADVKLREEARRACFQLLGPPPEQKDAFNRNADGTAHGSKQQIPPKAVSPSKEPTEPDRIVPPPPKRRKKAKEPAATSRQATKVSPIMQQYEAAKEKHPGVMMLFRIGDFYEIFGDDAEAAHKILGLTLTTRDQTHMMAGFPHHQLEPYLQKLLKEGTRVAICDQVPDSTGKGPIKRKVRRIASPENDEK